MLWPSKLVIGSTAVALDDVLADLTIRHGREGINSDAQPASLQATLVGVDHAQVRAFTVSVPLVLSVKDGAGPETPRFTGTVTDASLDQDLLTVIAIGTLAQLPRYQVGASNWPAEAWSARVTRIFSEAGLSSTLDLVSPGSFDPQLAARDASTAGATTLGDYLNFLAPMIGCAVFDLPDGRIRVQPIASRSLAGAVVLNPADVLYAPTWQQVLPAGNVITVRYQADQGASVTVQDNASIAIYGRRPATVDTSFVSSADATTRANQRLTRGAYAHWNMGDAPIVRGLTLAIGTPVQVGPGLPDAAPYDPWTPFLEGWTDRITRDEWSMDLALSDPLENALVLPWNAVPASGYAWNQINQTTQWRDALTLDTLTPV